ncbi:hypothetical protein Kpol_282p6 [Vanderwaltozyma polyspora DSM 70294]|uniref:Inclusion body clearance protein IML2 n=1 Tax=Vanderwaltozyma polyspora (strain ATCC 22028 / DSM 70294 / BCRC 21397 / CBS 2163 / NBRC 10782 / NRRL Y-8283 / UCD 57-17) TaxID=436907 RepID=IML2_VANPO|nr:uncharacterized protein Kpol_282p6 [Vanderwaltozyma polyspora DSM 70294]A7TST2.1 RecName: Full=Inclusion body clearance protein IML2 [Vanderwaltozyma polyspora DSM 70294]EDO14679.1 hypothetical protein Kpol_282p6 [Vanderwaltozyma polyspora DSM 70294]
MLRVFGSLTRSRSSSVLSQDDKIKQILKQAHDFEIALQAMDYVLDDRAEEGLALLKKNEAEDGSDQTINVLARGVIEFLEATLGFEAEEMKKASETLAKAENLSLKSRQYAQKNDLKSSSLYAPGTVYAVTYTESCLLHALLMIFSESYVETAKALLKLRKAYYMLQEIFEEMKKVKQTNGNMSIYKSETNHSEASVDSSNASFSSVDIPYELTREESNNSLYQESAEKVQKMRVRRLTGSHIGNTPAIDRLRSELGLDGPKVTTEENSNEYSALSENMDFSQATIDEFIHSGVNLCYGILQVVLSLLPSGIGAVLSVVGFHGSREDGLRLVWRATKQRNIHGCIGLLGLMFYYDGPFQFTDADFDIPVPENELKKTKSSSTYEEGDLDGPTLLHPGKILEDALLQSRALFPHSALWLLNEATMLSGQGRLRDSVKLMDSIEADKIEMRQVKSLLIFNRALTLVHLHEYERAADDFLSLLDISSWSHSLYHYFAGSCYLEIYRMHQLGVRKSDRPEHFKQRATDLIFGAPNLLTRKSFNARPLPLDRFMLRKVDQFKATQKRLKLSDPLDAIATSPVHELQYFYNGYNRMGKQDLELANIMLTEYHNPAIDAKEPNQEMIKDFLVSLTYRRLDRAEEGCELLDRNVLPKIFTMVNGKVKYFKKTEDPWLYPSALYERSLFSWKLKHMDGLEESKEWLTRAQGYADDYELSTRVEMKIKAAIDRVDESL